jgi:peptidoglycan/LPS O-acetylase OafA/YrhL
MDRREEIASLTGLRGLAALLVVIGHFSQWTIVAPRAEMPTWIAQWGGATPGIGMSIFFTLSGYVIALSYAHWNWRERPGFNLVRFFFYRFARLYRRGKLSLLGPKPNRGFADRNSFSEIAKPDKAGA